MHTKITLTKKDLTVLTACALFTLANLAAIGAAGRKRAKEAICLSNLRQWGTIFKMFLDDNEGRFIKWYDWITPLRRYYPDAKVFLCPEADNRIVVPDAWPERGGKFSAWERSFNDLLVRGSYGFNLWLSSSTTGGRPEEHLWKSPRVKGAATIPLLTDAVIAAFTPLYQDEPPLYDGHIYISLPFNVDEMRSCCFDRHGGGINILLGDDSAKKIGLKQLWQLKWHRQWNAANYPPPVWPDWMRNFKDYSYAR